MRNPGLTIVAALAGAVAAICVLGMSPVEAQSARVSDGQRVGAAQQPETSAQSRRRARTQLRIERRRTYLPPNAVRACDAWYEQEFRPSGTVIVPRMRCRWVTS